MTFLLAFVSQFFFSARLKISFSMLRLRPCLLRSFRSSTPSKRRTARFLSQFHSLQNRRSEFDVASLSSRFSSSSSSSTSIKNDTKDHDNNEQNDSFDLRESFFLPREGPSRGAGDEHWRKVSSYINADFRLLLPSETGDHELVQVFPGDGVALMTEQGTVCYGVIEQHPIAPRESGIMIFRHLVWDEPAATSFDRFLPRLHLNHRCFVVHTAGTSLDTWFTPADAHRFAAVARQIVAETDLRAVVAALHTVSRAPLYHMHDLLDVLRALHDGRYSLHECAAAALQLVGNVACRDSGFVPLRSRPRFHSFRLLSPSQQKEYFKGL
jgi:hypothetical protein